MAFSTLVIEHSDSAAILTSKLGLSGNDVKGKAVAIAGYIKSLPAGVMSADLDLRVGAVKATGSITSTGAASNNETMVVCGVTFTAKSSGATGNQFNVSGTVATQATNIATAINASADVNIYVSASAALGVVTLTALQPGVYGNAFSLTESMSNVTVSAFSGGSDGTLYAIDLS